MAKHYHLIENAFEFQISFLIGHGGEKTFNYDGAKKVPKRPKGYHEKCLVNGLGGIGFVTLIKMIKTLINSRKFSKMKK